MVNLYQRDSNPTFFIMHPKTFISLAILAVLLPITLVSFFLYDPLPSWNEGRDKDLMMFIAKDFVIEKENKIAVFDLDGTLWPEKPLWLDVQFHLLDPTATEGDWDSIHTAYSNIDQHEYIEKARMFIESRDIKPYKPMVELIDLLQDNEYDVYIVTGASAGFVRSISEEMFNIPRENVIGTHPDYHFNNMDGVLRGTEALKPNLWDEKVINIQKHIGRMPVLACGNSSGDAEMLKVAIFLIWCL